MDILHDLDRSLRSANTLAGIFAAMDTALQHYLDTDTRKQAHEALTRQAPPMNSAMALALHIYAASRLLEGMNPLGNDDRRRHQRMLETLRYRSEMERSVLWKRLVPAKLSPRSMGMLLRVMGPGVFFDKGIERFLPRNEHRRALMLPFQIGEQEAKPEYHVVGAVLPEVEGPDGRGRLVQRRTQGEHSDLGGLSNGDRAPRRYPHG